MIAAVGHKCANVNEAAVKMLYALEHDRLDGDKKIDANSRMGIINNSNLMSRELIDPLFELYKSTRNNPGNTTAHRSVSNSTMDTNDEKISALVGSGAKFFVQAMGVADSENPSWPNGHPYYGKPFVWPAEGTLLKAEKSSGLPDVKFSMEHVLNGISYRSLEGRVKKGTNGDGKTNKKKVLRFQDYQLRYTNGIARYHRSEFFYINDCGVMEVQFVKTSELTTSQSGRKFSKDEDVHAKYEKKFQETLELYNSNGNDVSVLEKEQVCILLWVGFEIFYRKDSKKNKKKITKAEFQAILSQNIQKNPSWLMMKQPHTK